MVAQQGVGLWTHWGSGARFSDRRRSPPSGPPLTSPDQLQPAAQGENVADVPAQHCLYLPTARSGTPSAHTFRYSHSRAG